MKINVKVRKLFKEAGALKAVVSVTFEDMIAAHDIKVVENEKGRFMLMPTHSFKVKDGKEVTHDVFHPVNAKARAELQEAVFAAYEAALAETDNETVENGVNN